MKLLLHITFCWGLLMAAPMQALANITIFACEPEWESLAKEIGKEKITIKTATTAFTDPHHIRAKPSLMAAIRRSDLVICSGNELEVGWLPILLERAKASVQPGQVGHLMAADYVKKLEVPERLDRSLGDIHPGGNPHIHLNPHNILLVAKELANRLRQIDNANAGYYSQNLDHFTTKWQHAITKWEKKAKPVKGVSVVVHHKSWVYLIDWLDLQLVATLEPKPGIPPSISHLETVLETLNNKPVAFIIHTPYEDSTASNWLSKKTNIPILNLPYTVGGNEHAQDLFSLFDSMIQQLVEAIK